MDSILYVNAPLKITFEQDEEHSEEFKREYDQLSSIDDDSVSEWLRLAKARGETGESDQVLLTLVVELHKKIDELSAYVKGERQEFLKLGHNVNIEALGHDHFKLVENILEEGIRYYGRVEMPFFPKREVPLYFKALSKREAQITLIHERDDKDWSSYVVARERIMIREMRANKDGR
jgi:hypothetical protein